MEPVDSNVARFQGQILYWHLASGSLKAKIGLSLTEDTDG